MTKGIIKIEGSKEDVKEFTQRLKKEYIEHKILDIARGITYKRAKLSRFEKIKIFFGFMKEPKRVEMKQKSLFDLIPKAEVPIFKYKIGEIA